MAPELTSEVLDALSQSEGPILSADAFPSIPSTTLKSALDRLGSREMVAYKKIDREEALLTPEAEGIAANGSHEARVFEAVLKAVEGLKIADLPVRGADCRLMCDGKSYDRSLTMSRASWVKKAQKLGKGRLSKKGG